MDTIATSVVLAQKGRRLFSIWAKKTDYSLNFDLSMLRLWPSTLVECRSTVVSNCRHRCGDKDRNSWLDVLAEQRFNIQSA
ncbi:hypothetical protein EVAR_98229_1 [Eumeta japonica]|uniref:Uncharacterized protein n=1 Tax=Eumeta variegata TaxID=151549 RepID=A0A4C2A9Z0_EUMVA|nr:hypothetical protein EVAR_98229_1 [Eumeta japonica]